VAQQRGNGRQIHRFNQAPSSVVAEPMRVNMRDIGATTEHCQQVANTAIRVWLGRYSFDLPEQLTRGELRSLRDPSEATDQEVLVA